MKKSKRTDKNRSYAKRRRGLLAGVFACILLAAGAATAIAKYDSGRGTTPSRNVQSAAPAQAAGNYVTVEVGGKTLKVNAQSLQQGPLTQEQSRQIADALKDNKSTDGLVEVQHADGSVSVDLQGRFQNVMMAKKNDDGSVSQACVDNPAAAAEFLSSKEPTSNAGTNGKATEKE